VPTASIRQAIGLPPDDRDAYRQACAPRGVLAPWPIEFDGAGLPGAVHLGPLAWDPPRSPQASSTLDRDEDERPIVLVTTSTSIVDALRDDVTAYLEAAIEGLADLPVRAIVTAGDLWPADRAVPPNVNVVRHLPHASVMPRTAVLVTHGGWGSISRGLRHGVPMVVVPFAIDQPLSAELVEANGVGVFIPPELLAPETLYNTVSELLPADAPARLRCAGFAAAAAEKPADVRAAEVVAGLNR
jgi:UDP:flavonoid glycosyltransferase YjiC (YdhE family)